jgi:chromosome segregation and condensation protein ScpB
MNNNLDKSLELKIEAILFFKGEPVSLKRLKDILKVSEEEIKEAVLNLKNNLEGRGIVLLDKEDEITLGTHPELSGLIEDLQKEELKSFQKN